MKKIFNSLFIMAAITAMVSTSSCTKVCDPGYEGSDCKTEVRAKFLKNNAVVADNCTGTGYNQNITAKASDVEFVVFSNLGNYQTPAVVEAKVDGTTLSATNFVDATGRKFTITGTLSGSTLTVNYTVVYSDNTSDNCVATISF